MKLRLVGICLFVFTMAIKVLTMVAVLVFASLGWALTVISDSLRDDEEKARIARK